GVPEKTLEETRGLVVQPEERLALAGGRVVVAALGQGHPVAARQPLDDLGELEVLHLHQEGEDVAAGTTPEAVEDAALLVHRERGRLFGMEGTEPDVIPPDALHPDLRGHDLEDVGAVTQLEQRRFGDAAAHRQPPAAEGDRRGTGTMPAVAAASRPSPITC